MKNIISIGMVVSILFACQSKKTEENAADNSADMWTESVRAVFIKNCQQVADDFSEEKAAPYCTCLLDIIIEKYPDPVDAESLGQDELEELIITSDCHTEEFEQILKSSWDEESGAVFIKSCKEAALKSGDTPNEADQFCQCALDNFRETLPNPHLTSGLTQREYEEIINGCK